MKVVGMDLGLAVLLNTMELEAAILRNDDESFVKDLVKHDGQWFYICHFMIRDLPKTVVLRIDEPDNTIYVCDWKRGYLWRRDFSIEDRNHWLED